MICTDTWLRRHALQLSGQLPDNYADGLEVLTDSDQLLAEMQASTADVLIGCHDQCFAPPHASSPARRSDMKKLLLTGVATLLLTGAALAISVPANARPWAAFFCGKLQVAMLPLKYFTGPACNPPCDGNTHFFDMKKDPDHKRPLSNRLFRMSDDGDLLYMGRKCREFIEKDYDALQKP